MKCINCHSELDPNDKYCKHCGNKVVSKRLTVKNIAIDINQQFFNYDNKLLVTFLDLFKKPEVVIDSFLAGNRKRYVNVISYLALSLTLSGLQLFITQKFFPETIDGFKQEDKGDNIQFDLSLDMEGFMDYFGIVMIIFLPFAAFGTYALLFKRRHNYAEHIILNMYLTAQYTIMLFILTLIGLICQVDPIPLLITLTMISYGYIGYALKRIYNLSILGALWRTIVSQLIISTIVSMIVFGIVIVIVIATKLF